MINNSCILCLHRVGDNNKNIVTPNSRLKITTEELEKFIKKSKKVKFISIDELCHNFDKKKVPKNVINLTFDDGYLDNFTNAFPILKYFNIPFTIYITTNFISNNFIPWWYKLENIINNNKEINFNGTIYKTMSINEKNETFLKLREICLFSKIKMNELQNYIELNSNEINQESIFLNWEQINILIESNIVTIGAHTKTHVNLSSVSDFESEYEIINSKKEIELRTNESIRHFAYPYGNIKNYSKREIDILKNNNFSTSVSTNYGFLKKNSFLNCYELPRITLDSDFFTFRNRSIRFIKKF